MDTLLKALPLITLANLATPIHADTVEWAPFITQEHVDERALLDAADQVNTFFLSQQPGFVRRTLIKKGPGEYADIIYWSTSHDAEAAGEKAMHCQPCLHYFALMDAQASATAGAGFTHYTIIKTW